MGATGRVSDLPEKNVTKMYGSTLLAFNEGVGAVAYPRGFSGCPETPPDHNFFIQGVTPLLAPTLTSHLHLRLLETHLETNSGYATGVCVKFPEKSINGKSNPF